MKVAHVTVLVEKGYVPTEFALVQDVLRIASRLSSDLSFAHKVCTTQDERLVEGKGGALVRASAFQSDYAALPNHLVVLGGAGIRCGFHCLKAWLSWMKRVGVGGYDIAFDHANRWVNL